VGLEDDDPSLYSEYSVQIEIISTTSSSSSSADINADATYLVPVFNPEPVD